MTRWIACCFVAAALWAGPAAADCPVLFKGNHALPVGQPVGTWQAAHAAVKGAPVADEAAAQKALCAPGVPCGGAGPVHVLDRDQLTLLVADGAGGFQLYPALGGALPTYGDQFQVTVAPLPGSWLHVQATHEIGGREQMCDDGECPSAYVIQGYGYTDLVFQGARLAFAATCQTDDASDRTPSQISRDGDRFRYTACGAGHTAKAFRFPTPDTCEAVVEPLTDAKAALQAGRAAATKLDWAGAIDWFDRLVIHDPARADWRGERGYLHLKAGAVDAAEADLRAALGLAKAPRTKGMILFNLGLVLEARGQPAQALEAFRQSDAVRPHKAAKARIKALAK